MKVTVKACSSGHTDLIGKDFGLVDDTVGQVSADMEYAQLVWGQVEFAFHQGTVDTAEAKVDVVCCQSWQDVANKRVLGLEYAPDFLEGIRTDYRLFHDPVLTEVSAIYRRENGPEIVVDHHVESAVRNVLEVENSFPAQNTVIRAVGEVANCHRHLRVVVAGGGGGLAAAVNVVVVEEQNGFFDPSRAETNGSHGNDCVGQKGAHSQTASTLCLALNAWAYRERTRRMRDH
mmetsp:Transcript_18088/g.25492  ORF Transcript_18088/g.25492 Transcript_18088/m.25492 type:complete len:232 (-) Transcript_18088:1579-2274(-)